ncbi:MAG: 7-cyano-7-deazaguanine synthase, partial [Bermanella sp.]
VEVRAPFLAASKTDILREGLVMNLDYNDTWTCYNGQEKACGRCGACQERLEAFSENNTIDPIDYQN